MLLLGAVPAFGADREPSGWLELDAGPAGQVHRLIPGGSADWAVDIQVLGEPATSLELGLHSDPTVSGALRDHVSVQLRACLEPWEGSLCPGGHRVLMQPTPLTAAGEVVVDLMEPGNFQAGSSHVLLTATLAADVPHVVQGNRAQIIVGVHGSGDDAGAGGGASPANPAGPSSSILADTGARLGGFALLGFLAVAAGFGLARLRGGGT